MIGNGYKLFVSPHVPEKKTEIKRECVKGRGLVRKKRVISNDDLIVIYGENIFVHPLVAARLQKAIAEQEREGGEP